MLPTNIDVRLIFWVVLSVFAVYRVSMIIAVDDIFDGFRERLGEAARKAEGSWKIRFFGFWGSLFSCPFCLGVWFAMLPAFLLAGSFTEFVLLWLGIAGLQDCLIYRKVE